MKIILINKFHYLRGGAETYYFDLGEVLAQHGHEVHYFSMDDKQNEPAIDEKYFVSHQEYVGAKTPLEKIRALSKTIYSNEAKQKLKKMIIDIKPDLIHINNYHRQLSCSIFDAAKELRVPVIMTAHDATNICPQIYMHYQECCTQCSTGKYYHCLLGRCIKGSLSMSLAGTIEGYVSKFKQVYDKIDCLIVPSGYIADVYEKDGFDKKKIRVMHNAKRINKINVESWPERKYMIFFGRLSREKGIITLLQAITKINTIPIYIVGEGPEESNIKNFIAEHRLSEKVKLIGYKNGHELTDLIFGSRFAVIPSQTPENCPYGVIEAFACGVPVVGSALGGIPELITEGETGWTFSAGDVQALASVLKMAESKAPMLYGNCYRTACEQFSMEHYCEKVVHAYEEVIKNYGVQ